MRCCAAAICTSRCRTPSRWHWKTIWTSLFSAMVRRSPTRPSAGRGRRFRARRFDHGHAGPSGATVSASGTTPGNNQNAASQASAATLSASAAASSILRTADSESRPDSDRQRRWAHQTTPQSNAFITGTTSLIQRQDLSALRSSKGLPDRHNRQSGPEQQPHCQQQPRNDFNPSTISSLGLSITQHLLQGFGPAINSRQIHIARNNREVPTSPLSSRCRPPWRPSCRLYWQLVALNEAGGEWPGGGRRRATALRRQQAAGGGRDTWRRSRSRAPRPRSPPASSS